MNTIKYINVAMLAMSLGVLASCNDYLDKEPLSQVSPEGYFDQEAHLEAYANARYTDILPRVDNYNWGLYAGDVNTDNMVTLNFDNIYIPGKWHTSMSDDNYNFGNINTCNYFFEQVLPKYEDNKINGNSATIRHYIGEMYFFRAFEYFTRLQQFGDFPIITECLPDEMDVLSEASRRYPCNEVARFIMEDLDRAYEYMSQANLATTRLSSGLAMLIKSRVALYMGTWLKNFADTPFVPNGEGWPGATKEYNAGYQFPAGSLENEYNWFLDQAIEAADMVASSATLTTNTGIVPQTEGASLAELDAENPWLAMFASLDLSSYGEVMLWRKYDRGLGVVHGVATSAQHGNAACGSTRGLVDCFVMKDGLPIYASPLYQGDETITKVRTDRDPRLFVFLKEPGQKNILINDGVGSHGVPVEPYPEILESDDQHVYSTGYAMRKGSYYASQMMGNGDNYTAIPYFRSVEALLNYIEAYYERYGNLGGNCRTYWERVRARHTGLDTDFQKTINATVMEKEAKGDWGAYTAGQLVDPVRYNIRRERRCELVAENFRMMDLKRWRSFDQLITEKYHIEGFHIWGTPMQEWYDQEILAATISPASRSEYLRPFENRQNEAFDGLSWSMAHYLRPMPIYQMMLTSPDHVTVENSPIYQNPYWPSQADMPATK